MRIEIDNLSYSYSAGQKGLEVKALKNVSLTIEEGDFYGIIGHTGSGKSTLIQHINGLIKIGENSGSIRVGEFDLTDKKCDFNKLRSLVGMVFQYPEYQLFSETVFLDVAFGLKNFFPDLKEEEIEERVKTAIELVGLDYEKVKDKSPFELSGGQKRRVAIAGTIVSKPEILVLDEPAAGLDPIGKRDFLKLLKNLHKGFVKTIIIVSHDMDLVAEHCNRACVMNHGEVFAEGSPKDIFSRKNDLLSLGLDLPLTAFISDRLKSNGIDITNDFTEEDFIRSVKKWYEGEKR